MTAPGASSKAGFDPSQHLRSVGGNDYLPVKWCLVWLREEHPEATVETQLVAHVDTVAIFRAQVRIPTGGSATGYGSESASDFRDYLEKAETKAIGRALRALGYGAQFSTDHEIPAEGGAPITDISARRSVEDDGQPAPAGQITYLRVLAAKIGIDEDTLQARAMAEFGLTLPSLSRHQATQLSELIRAVPKPSSSPQQADGRQPTPLPGVDAACGSAGNDHNTR
jgi:hypothetical protein